MEKNTNIIGHPVNINIPISKIDEESRMVYGYATVEEVDKHGEIIGYEASKKAFAEWPGNIREMHDPKAVGLNKEVTFDDAKKGVWIGAYVSESADGENAWTKVKEGILGGFSIGGTIKAFEIVDVDGEAHAKVTDYRLDEVSLVDNPACPSAVFQMVKSVKGGGLERVEEMRKGAGHPVAWWERQFQFSENQQVIKQASITYNGNSMNKDNTLAKSMWQAQELVELAYCLSDYIWFKQYYGEDQPDLRDALDKIKAAASKELLEAEDFPEVEGAIENACKALNITKVEELHKMADDKKELNKSVTGSEDRDHNAEPVKSAEDNGKPLNDTAESAAANDLPAAGTPTGDGETQPVVTDPKKATTASDLKKSAESTDALADLKNAILEGVNEMVKSAVTPLQEEINQLKGAAAPTKVKSSFSEVTKGEEVKTSQSEADERLETLMKKADEYAANPNKGTMAERIQLSNEIRKAQRAADPASVAQANAIRAQFNTAV